MKYCLWCEATLGTVADEANVIHCDCGVRYSNEVVKGLSQARWDAIARRDGFEVERDGDALYVTELDTWTWR